MFGRLGFFGRLTLIVLLLVAALYGLRTGLLILSDEGRRSETQFPIPEQVAAIVDLLDGLPVEQMPTALRAVSSEYFKVSISDKTLVGYSDFARMPGLEWIIQQHLETPDDRVVMAVRLQSNEASVLRLLFERFSIQSQTPVAVSVSLSSGAFALFTITGSTTQKIFGVPVGFLFGVCGFFIAALALWAIAREARPLTQLANSVEAFGKDVLPRPLDSGKGAPEIRRLITAVNDMQERISGLIKGRAILLGAVSHDLKTYITRLRMRVDELPDEESIVKATLDLEHMTKIIDDAIAVARTEYQQNSLEMIDLQELLAEDLIARGTQVTTVNFQRGIYTIVGDGVALKRLFANLLDNALRYGTEISVSGSHSPGLVEIYIEDNGPGIPPDERHSVFEPFYRIERARDHLSGGSGLGLAIVNQIATAHGGSVFIEDSPLGGARFGVRLPLTPI